MYMYYCPKCEKFFKNDNKDNMCKCSNCKGVLVPRRVTDTVWGGMSHEERRDIIEMALSMAIPRLTFRRWVVLSFRLI